MESPNYYEILGVDPGTSPEGIKRAFRDLAKRYHPDVSDAPDAAQRMLLINEAYRTLGDPIARATYDLMLRQRQEADKPNPSPKTPSPSRPRRVRPLEYYLWKPPTEFNIVEGKPIKIYGEIYAGLFGYVAKGRSPLVSASKAAEWATPPRISLCAEVDALLRSRGAVNEFPTNTLYIGCLCEWHKAILPVMDFEFTWYFNNQRLNIYAFTLLKPALRLCAWLKRFDEAARFPVGNYRVDVSMNGRVVGGRVFQVVPARTSLGDLWRRWRVRGGR
ncbi:MAG: DnaJ domain-containing protein [Abditibacteriales bacterium]|nr:DnaJ domain-containing protein [Abditibacteriales bacterium]MDW8365396.1 DnaJ domain-containing protein [Abditibacteriales bacterium]